MSESSKSYTVHMIANAHIDPVWLWPEEEGREVVLATCRAMVEMLGRYPEFTFVRSSAATYRWIEEDDPKLFAEISRYIKEGRWEVVGGWWVQPDCNLPCGESFVRHALYGKGYFEEKFGVDVKVGYNVDSFGHCATLPQILKKCGIDYYIFFRPDPKEKELPQLFWWEAPDGTRVLACRPPLHYGFGPNVEDIRPRILEAYRQTVDGLKDVLCFYGVGDHGGGPTEEHVRQVGKADSSPDFPRVVFGNLEAFFEKVKDEREFPVVRDELQHHARGCYTSVSLIKYLNRSTEHLLMTAERFSSVAFRYLGLPYPGEALSEAWRTLLFHQFHDLLDGTAIRPAYRRARERLWGVRTVAHEALQRAIRCVASHLKLSSEGTPLLVFNPSPWRRKDLVEAKVPLSYLPKVIKLSDPDGNDLPVQLLGVEDEGGKYLVQVLFVAEVPGLGYRLYTLSEGEPVGEGMEASPTCLRNLWYELKVDPETGAIGELYMGARRTFSGPAGVLQVLDDPSDAWAHGVDSFEGVCGTFLREGDVRVVERGPVRATVRTKARFGGSWLLQDISLYNDLPRVEVRLEVDWHERHRMARLVFPLAVSDPTFTCEVPYGSVSRTPTGEEEPGLRWADITGRAGDGTFGMSLVNDRKYGYSARGPELRLSVLRSPIYGFHDPRRKEGDVRYRYMDQGLHGLRYVLLPHNGSWREAGTVRLAWELNEPLIPLPPLGGGKDLGPEGGFLEVKPGNVIPSVLKKAEDGDELVLRLYETSGRATEAELCLPQEGRSYRIRMGPYEIKTLKLPSDLPPREVDMLERG